MSLFARISDLLKANINDLLARAEDPERMLNAAIEDMQRQLIDAKSRVAMSIADEKRLEKQYRTQASKAADWEKKAMSAVRAERDDLARDALARKKEHEVAAAQFKDQLEDQQAAVRELKSALSALTSKLDETRRRRTLLVARAKRAEAQRQLAHTLNAANESSAAERLQRLEARVERAEAEAEATWEVSAHSVDSGGDLEREIALLGTGTEDLDDDLAALKAKMNDELPAGTPVKALPSSVDADDELELPTSDEDLEAGHEAELAARRTAENG